MKEIKRSDGLTEVGLIGIKDFNPDSHAQIGVFENISDGIIVLKHDWTIFYANHKAAEYLQCDKVEDLYGKNLWDEYQLELGKNLYNACKKALKTKEFIQLEDYVKSWKKHITYRIVPSFHGLTIYFLDITEQKEVEKKLRDSLNVLEETQEIAHLGNWYVDLETLKIQWSDEMYHIFGVLKEEFDHTADAFIKFIHPDDQLSIKNWMDQSITGVKLEPQEFKIVLPNHEVRWIRGDGKLISDGEGNPTALIGSAMDITLQKKNEEKLRKNQAFIEDILNSSPNIIFIYDIAKEVPIYTNLAAQEYLEYSKKDIDAMGTHVAEGIMPPEDFDFYQKNIQSAYKSLKGNEFLEFESHIKSKSGQLRIFNSREQVFSRNPDGTPAQIFGMLTDITESRRLEKEKRALEKNFQIALKNISDIVTVYDKNKKIIFVNETTQKNVDLPFPEGSRKQNRKKIPEEVIRIFKPALDEVYQTHEKRVVEDWIVFPDGRKNFVRITYIPVIDEDGDLFEVIGVTQDFTERKITEIQIRESEERYRLLIESLPYAIMVYQDGQIVFANPTAIELFGGHDLHDLIGKTLADFIHKDDLVSANEKIFRLQKDEENLYPAEYRYKRLDGQVFYVEETCAPFLYGRRPAVQSIIFDISDRKKVQQELLDASIRRQILIEQSRDGIVIMDEKGKVQEANLRAAEMAGYTPDEFAKMSVFDWDAKYSKKQIQKMFKSIDEKGSFFITTHKRKDGSIFDVEISANASIVNGKKLVFNVIRDITERTKAQHDLENSLVQLRQAIATTIEVLIEAVEIRDPYTAGHQRRVANLARVIGSELQLPDETIQGLRYAASIHDIGKISIPTEILSKPSKLSEMEYAIVKEHAQSGYDILKHVDTPWPLADIVYQHHERMNGSGYPNGLKGNAILLEARILAVADVVEAMASHRPYRPARGLNAALEEIEKNKGVLYDERVVDACLKLFKEKRYSFND